MPTNRGSVVNDMRKPPKFAAIDRTTTLNNCPPGAAVSPISVRHIVRQRLRIGFYKVLLPSIT